MSQTLGNVYNNVSYSLQNHAAAMARLQEQTSSGSRINRVSDKPLDAYQVMTLTSWKVDLENYLSRLADVSDRLEFSSSVINNISTQLSEAKTSLTQLVSGTYTEQQRQINSEHINDILEQIVALANSKFDDQYIFGGDKADSAPYSVERTDGKITAVNYQGSMETRNVDVASGIQSSGFLVGDDVFQSDERSEPVFLGSTGAEAGTGTSTVTGDVWLEVTYDGSNYQLSIDGGESHTTVPAGGDTNQAVTHSQTGKVLYVDSTGINSTGVELVRVPGTYNIFDTLISMRDMLKNERNFSEQRLQTLLGESFDSINEVKELLVENELSIGTKVSFLEDLSQGIENVKYNAEDSANQLQEADIAQIAMDLSKREVLYQLSMSIASRIMSMSLLDFM